MILSTCCYVKKNAGLSFDELHGVVGVAKVGTSALPVALKAVFNRGRGYFRKVPITEVGLYSISWSARSMRSGGT
jgi:hypothetical protein